MASDEAAGAAGGAPGRVDPAAVETRLGRVEARLDAVERVLARVDAGDDPACARCGAPLAADVLVADPLLATCTPTCPS